MGSPRRKRAIRSWVTHRRMMAVESWLLVALGGKVLDELVMAAALPRWAKLMFSMAVAVGLFAALLVMLRSSVRVGVSTAHGVTRQLLLPRILAHAALLLGIAYLYANVLRLWPPW